MSVIHILKAMGPRNTLVIRYCCHGLKYNRQEFYLRSGLKLDLDLTPAHRNTTRNICSYIWTPFSDQESEGLFLNMNNNEVEAELQVWDKAEPNGDRDENFVVIRVPQATLNDVAGNKLSCSSCRVSSSLLLQLDGLCEHSLIGNVVKINGN